MSIRSFKSSGEGVKMNELAKIIQVEEAYVLRSRRQTRLHTGTVLYLRKLSAKGAPLEYILLQCTPVHMRDAQAIRREYLIQAIHRLT